MIISEESIQKLKARRLMLEAMELGTLSLGWIKDENTQQQILKDIKEIGASSKTLKVL